MGRTFTGWRPTRRCNRHSKAAWLSFSVCRAWHRSSEMKDLTPVQTEPKVRRRIKGSHHIFRKPGVEEKLILQKDGNKAKPYQVKQVWAVIFKYKLGGEK